MKKILFFAAVAVAAICTSCSKELDTDKNAGLGKYTLPEITATLEADNLTRTGLGSNQVVNWSATDRIAIINTSNDKIYQYVLTSGAGTSVGRFEPIDSDNIATYISDPNELKAVYPAIAASVTGGVISFEINKDWSEEDRNKYGITSWTKDTPYSFTYNDIKVSYNTLEIPSESSTPVNFKFRQLGTWCTFVFDFTGSTEYKREAMESITVTTADGTMISGSSEVNFDDPAAPALNSSGNASSVKWEFGTPSSMSAPISRSLMLYPGLEDEQLQITVKTSLHTFTFYATPNQPLAPGTTLRFPIEVGKNFTEGSAMADFTYSVEDLDTGDPFYYYGKTNCVILTDAKTSHEIDIKPYQTNAYYERIDGSADGATKAAAAKVIWKESTLENLKVTFNDATKITVEKTASQYGNALVGIYDSDRSDATLLWSYHIWCPEVDPVAEDGLLEYTVTNSGAYKVMPLFLGGTVKPAANEIKAAGLWYQWGRKDPLGRPSGWNTSATVAVIVNDGSPDDDFFTTNAGTSGETNRFDIADGGELKKAGYIAGNMELDRFMIEYSIENPTKFIYDSNGETYSYNWTGKVNDNLWGNPQGYNFPRPSQLGSKSIFDPCPEGYRVAPKDLFLNFTTTKANSGTVTDKDDKEKIFNATNPTDLAGSRGYDFYYTGNKTDGGLNDFYPASGYRSASSGGLAYVGSNGYSWSSAPYSSGSTYAGYLYFYATYVSPLNGNYRAYGFPVRCVRE